MFPAKSNWRLILSLLVLSPFGGAIGMAQSEKITVVMPGDGAVDGSFIEAYTNQWKMTYISADGDSSSAGAWTDSVAIVERSGGSVLERFQVVYAPSGEEKFRLYNAVDHESLIPLEGEQRTPDNSFNRLQFSGKHVTGEIKDPEVDPVIIDTSLDIAGFDFNIYGTLLLGFPLEPGYRAKFPIIEIDTKENYPFVSWVTMAVTGEETVNAGHLGERRTTIVETTSSVGELRFFLTKEPPYVIKLIRQQPDGNRMIWEME